MTTRPENSQKSALRSPLIQPTETGDRGALPADLGRAGDSNTRAYVYRSAHGVDLWQGR